VLEITLSVAVFTLAVAVIGLFAMMGALSARVPDQESDQQPDPTLQTLDDVPVGVEPESWPAAISHLATAERAVLVVFSTLCASCERIARGDTGALAIPPAAGVLISTSRESRGQQFLDEHPMLRDYPCAIDAGGHWLTGALGVDTSPAVLVFERGRLRSAQTFTAAGALRQLPMGLPLMGEDGSMAKP